MITPSTPRRATLRRATVFGWGLALSLLAAGCDRPNQPTEPASTSAATSTKKSGPTKNAKATPPAPSAQASADALAPVVDSAGFAKLVETLSEPDAEFFSDNYISNETSYLQIAETLDKGPKGGVYIGVGPEQNFTYIALMQPEQAYIVDIRRDNLVLHLLYKAAFEKASSRSHFLALLTGRDYAGDAGLSEEASLEEVLAHSEKSKATKESFERVHASLLTHITEGMTVDLDERDRRTLKRSHRAFFQDGLDIRFSLKKATFRKYPSLRELALQKAKSGKRLGFLASKERFAIVQRMQKENRIVPLVGDFAGDRAMPALAKHITEQKQTVRGFYVSNVEQYLMVDGKWWKWQRNVAAFPIDDESLFLRCYLDQGTPHPQQMEGHRTATTVHRISDFNARKKPYKNLLALASDRPL